MQVGLNVYEAHSHSHCYLSYSSDLDTLRQRMNISLDGYGGNRGDCFLLEFCSVTAANGILCGVEEIGRISSSRSPGKQGPIYIEEQREGEGERKDRGRCSHTGEREECISGVRE